MLSFGIVATFTLFIINYTATIINVLFAFTPSQFTRNSLIVVNQEEKKEGFNNPLISASDLNTGSYDPKIINNIYRFEGNDHWFCKNCAMKGDKWFMMKHPCNNINNNK